MTQKKTATHRAKPRSKKKKRVIKKRKKTNLVKKIFFNRNLWFLIFGIFIVLFFFYLIYLDQKIIQRFEGRIWKLPAHVYSRPLELFVGKSISINQLKFELENLKYQKTKNSPQQNAQYNYWSNVFNINTRDFIFWDGKESSHRIKVVIENNQVTQLINRSNHQNMDIARFDAAYLTGIFPALSQDRILLKLDDVPDIFIKMLLLIEDRRFFTHYGVDPRSIARAFMANISSGKTVQGGSTLTQQLVKNLFLSQKKKLSRKINEAFMALLLEFHYDKKLILETYLNEIYLGQDGKRAIHGFGLASEFYFGKRLNELAIDQLALLVGMVKGASFYNPNRNKNNAKKRRNIVLKTMLQMSLLDKKQTAQLIKKPILTVKKANAGIYPAFIDLVKVQLQQNYQSDDLQTEGLRIFTTLDPYIQFKTEQAIKKSLPQLSKNKNLQTAAVIVSPNNGDVFAMVGDRNPRYKGFNRALNAKRVIGSLIKPVIYLKALEDSSHYTLATLLDDSPMRLKIKNQKDWQPQNYDKKHHGKITLYQSLIKSYNIPAVRTALDVGLSQVVITLNNLGLTQNIDAFPSLALGALSLSPVQVASLYQTFAANGYHSPLRSVFAVLDKDQQPLQRYSLSVSNKVQPTAIALVNYAMMGVAKEGTARYLNTRLAVQAAGKTGTSDDLRDSWFAGFTGDLVAVVWTGFDNNKPTGLTGSSGALKVWQSIMQDISYKSYQLPKNPNLVKYWVDKKNNLLTDASCENAVELLFIEGTQPKNVSACGSGQMIRSTTTEADNAPSERSKSWLFDLFNSE